MKVIAASLAPYQESAMQEDSKPDMFINPRYPGGTPEMVGPALLRPREPEERSDSDRESRSDGEGEIQPSMQAPPNSSIGGIAAPGFGNFFTYGKFRVAIQAMDT